LREIQCHARQFLVNGLNDEKSLHLVTRRGPDTRLQEAKLLRRNSALTGEADLYQVWLLSRVLMPANPGLIKELSKLFWKNSKPTFTAFYSQPRRNRLIRAGTSPAGINGL
jgi:hypothetical protein